MRRWKCGDVEPGDLIKGTVGPPLRVLEIREGDWDEGVESAVVEREDGSRAFQIGRSAARLLEFICEDTVTGKRRGFRNVHPEASIYSNFVAQADEHYPVCGVCGDAWPCAHHRMDVAAARTLQEDAELCRRCLKPVTGLRVVASVVQDGQPKDLLFHGRKGACLEAARRLDPSIPPRPAGAASAPEEPL